MPLILSSSSQYLSMADALISFVVQQLASYVQEEVYLVVGVDEEVQKLTANLSLLQALLSDAERKQVKNSAVKVWLEELRDIIYAADDVLDEWRTKTLLSQAREGNADVASSSSSSNTSCYCLEVLSFFLTSCYCFKRVSVRYDISHQIKEIGQRIDAITAQRGQFGLVVSEKNDERRFSPNNLTTSAVDVSGIYGRQCDMEAISDMLLGESSCQGNKPVQVISIVGMGGMGKTTLAGQVYSEEKVVGAFEKRMWVCVSEPLDRYRIAKDIIEQVDRSDASIPDSVEALHQKLLECLQGKKFLLVLDDVWTEERALWEPLKLWLGSGASGSRILVTTRSQKVADMMGSSPSNTRKLRALSEEESWSVICHLALEGREDETPKFEKIGKQIAVKCKGVPLTIKILASLLCEEKEIGGWRDVVDSELWELAEVQDTIFSSLLMSFISLPLNSKLCFLYCAVFPKDAKMMKDVLIKLWMAQGFLGNDGTNNLEKIGEDNFDVLAKRSFFQDFENDSRGRILNCKMHDLVHDFAQYLRQGECYNLKKSNAREFDHKKVRHLWTSNLEKPSIFDAKGLRTLIVTRNLQSAAVIKMVNSLSCLRTLDFSQIFWSTGELKTLPKEVDKLLHLRYLNLSHTGVEELPETICNLYNLQTLDLSYCRSLCKLPDRIGDLSNLRHLNIEGTYKLRYRYLPHEIKRLGFLRTLSMFIVGGPNKISDLQVFNNLRGSLEIIGLEGVRDANEAAEACLNKKKLCALKFQFQLAEGDDVQKKMETVLEKLEPHEDLESVCIAGYPGYIFPNWMRDTSVLGNIVDMELTSCPNCTELPCLGSLPCLEDLKIKGMDSVKHIGNEFYWFGVGSSSSAQMTAFPKLKKLWICNMENLEEWELPISNNIIKIMPCLSYLLLFECPKLSALPGLGRLESLEKLQLEELPSMSALPGLGRLESLEILKLNRLTSVKCVGLEFLGISRDVGDEDGYSSVQNKLTSFPKLKELHFQSMPHLKRWIVPSSFQSDASVMIMPHLRDLEISNCRGLRELPDMSLFKSMETLELNVLPKWEGPPEEKEIVEKEKDDGGNLRSLVIRSCPRLTVVPRSLFSPMLRILKIEDCPRLGPKQPCLPSLLEELKLWFDTGIFSKSLPLNNDPRGHQHIITLEIVRSPHSSLPEGFNQLKALQSLNIWSCEHLDFQLEELQPFTMLQEFDFSESPLLRKRFQGEKRRSITSHLPKITFKECIIMWDPIFSAP